MPEFYGSKSHYRDHLEPIAAVMDRPVHGFARDVGPGPVVVASFLDLWRFKHRPAVLVEHGAGQTYGKPHSAYSGGKDRDNVVLFVCPSEAVAARNLARYPRARAVAVGCPKMDRWHLEPVQPEPIVGLAFHWFTGGVAPEARSALPHHQEALGGLRYQTLGTGHPRVLGHLRGLYGACGVPLVETDEVFRRCRVLVCDNSSVGWEFASLDRPVVWLNAPWYRRDVEHGLRFWEFADSGIQVDEPGDLQAAIEAAYDDPEPYRSRRREVIGQVYAYTDGKAAQRAAEAIEEVLWSRTSA